MTVAAQAISASSRCNGVTTSFPVPFPVVQSGDLDVAIVLADGSEQPLSEGTDYTVVGNLLAGTASITTATVWPIGTLLRRTRDTQLTQDLIYTPNDGFPAKSHERGLDKLTMISQEVDADLRDTQSRISRVPSGETMALLPALPNRRLKLGQFDAGGNLSPMPGSNALVSLGPNGEPGTQPLLATLRQLGTNIFDDGAWGGTVASADDGAWG